MSTDLNKAVDRRYFDEVLCIGNVTVIDEIMAPEYVGHTAGMPPADREADKGFIAMIHTGFPGIEFILEDQVAEGDKVFHRFTVRGTHNGDFMGIPATGRPAEITGMNINRFKEGKVVESWGIINTFGLMQQLGVIPS